MNDQNIQDRTDIYRPRSGGPVLISMTGIGCMTVDFLNFATEKHPSVDL